VFSEILNYKKLRIQQHMLVVFESVYL